MIGVSGLIGNSGDAVEPHESGGASGGSSEAGAASSSIPGGGGMEDSGGGGGGHRWPRQETLALLKIRSDMGAAFRDSSLKAPLWEEVSRKMAELGFQRSAKKCKEKFENVYKYHKRTKDGRSSKSDGKTYRFFDQLEALEHTAAAAAPSFVPPPPLPLPLPMPTILQHSSLISPNPVSMVLPTALQPAPNQIQIQGFQPPASVFFNTTSSSSSTSSDEDIQRRRRRGKKRKWKDFFRRLVKDVIRKQEELQATFLENLERRDRDRAAREEAWRAQERARLSREHELLVQERSTAAAKDAAVIAFLQKVTEQHNLQIPINLPPPPPVQPPQNPQPPPVNLTAPPLIKIAETSEVDRIGDNSSSMSSSRWPKTEVEALIKLRTNLDLKYQDTGSKGPLWEEISAAMASLGYNRSSKRCKEKWENINKYFKKVKESNKKRSEDSKTCPYFHQLDAIYREREKAGMPAFNVGHTIKPDGSLVAPIMARPEQQWPLPDQPRPDSALPDRNRDSGSENDDGDGGGDAGEEEHEGGEEGYEIVEIKQPHSGPAPAPPG